MKYLPLLVFAMLFIACEKSDDIPQNPTEPFYYPPTTGSAWETKSLASLGWNQSAVQPLKEYLTDKHTKSFMILVNGRIVMEEYFNGHTAATTWQWNSAGKTLVATTTGIAQQEGLLNINN